MRERTVPRPKTETKSTPIANPSALPRNAVDRLNEQRIDKARTYLKDLIENQPTENRSGTAYTLDVVNRVYQSFVHVIDALQAKQSGNDPAMCLSLTKASVSWTSARAHLAQHKRSAFRNPEAVGSFRRQTNRLLDTLDGIMMHVVSGDSKPATFPAESILRDARQFRHATKKVWALEKGESPQRFYT
jgi:hypothetical protein